MTTDNRIQLIQDDIIKLHVDAIVNAANSRLAGGGGVDGAIHKAAGPELYDACRKLNGCQTGSSKITPGYKLPSLYIIHTVGPVWRGGNSNEVDLLESCYNTSLKIATQNDVVSIAFPNISTGVYAFPKEEAAKIAISTVTRFLEKNQLPKEVIFVCFDEENYNIYSKILGTTNT